MKQTQVLHSLRATVLTCHLLVIIDLKAEFAVLGKSSAISQLGKVVAMGMPNGHPNTLTPGVVANITTENIIMHTAPTQPGSSGGPVVNEAFEVVGISSRGDAKFGYAIQIEDAIRVLSRRLKEFQLFPTGEYKRRVHGSYVGSMMPV